MWLLVTATVQAAPPSLPRPSAPDGLATYTHTVSMHLHCALSDGGTYSKISLFEDINGFTGFSDAITLESGRQVVTYTLSGPTSALPSNADIALVTVVDANCGGTHTFLVRSDGIGSVLVMDEL